mmetsp:Transcript_65582/g.128948  ORF Transcript_65582/g.128948 Transcript_65582/m.128948 type:complete len:247 (-) Transcript_65582:150-890(-)
MGSVFSGGGAVQVVGYEMKSGEIIEVEFQPNAGLGFVPWPGTFALAAYLDANAEALGLSNLVALELGSGSCSVAGLTAGKLCKKTVLTDRVEVIDSIGNAVARSNLWGKVDVRVLDWADLEFTMSAFTTQEIDMIFMTDVVYFDFLWKPLLHTLLLLCKPTTQVLWANCDGYPSYTPNVDEFLKMLEEFFEITVEQDRRQLGLGSPNELPTGRVLIRRLTLKDHLLAQEEVDRAMVKGCVRRRCMP